MPTITAVGFIGLGDQGAPMAQAIAESDFELHVWARRPAALEALSAVPHTVHDDPAALAAAVDLVALCLRDDTDVTDVLENRKLLSSIRPGTILVNHGTGDPAASVRTAARVAEAGGAYLDAPVSGGGPGARARTLTTFVGGPAETFAAARPVFETFSTTVRLMGAAGTGQLTKLFNNALTITNMKNAEDVLFLADQLGLDLHALIDVISVSSGGSAALRSLGTDITPELAETLNSLMRKDMYHFADAVGIDAVEVLARGLAGADGLVDAARLLNRSAAAG